jgi:hypothetical protein
MLLTCIKPAYVGGGIKNYNNRRPPNCVCILSGVDETWARSGFKTGGAPRRANGWYVPHCARRCPSTSCTSTRTCSIMRTGTSRSINSLPLNGFGIFEICLQKRRIEQSVSRINQAPISTAKVSKRSIQALTSLSTAAGHSPSPMLPSMTWLSLKLNQNS